MQSLGSRIPSTPLVTVDENDIFPDRFTLMVLGPRGSGKTSLITRYVRDIHSMEHDTTPLETSYYVSDNFDNRRVEIEIVDPPSPPTQSTDIQRADIFLLCFAANDRESLKEIHFYHRLILNGRDVEDVAMLLVATKCDDVMDRQVPHSMAMELAQSQGFPYFETSARTSRASVRAAVMAGLEEYSQKWHVNPQRHATLKKLFTMKDKTDQIAPTAIDVAEAREPKESMASKSKTMMSKLFSKKQ